MDPFQLLDQPPEWPLRLLHVPSMTSHENWENNTYNGAKEPQYNALSYTWGRWMIENGPVLTMHGTTWKMPSIHSDAFLVAQFQTCINLASQGVDFLWLDIACIDQENRQIKMSEIGRQADIFVGANTVFAWTAQLSVSEIQQNADMFAKLSDRVYEETWQMSIPEWSDDFEAECDISGVEIRVLPCFSDSDWVDAVVRANTIITAIAPIPEENKERFGLNRVQDLSDRLGFNARSFDNPTVLYTATRFRTTIDPLDRVYAIMLDETDLVTDLVPPELRRLNTISDERQHAIGTALIDQCGFEIRVLLIGSLEEAGVDGSDEMLGVLIVPATGGREQECWQRIGICLWPVSPGQEAGHRYSDMWEPSEIDLT